MLPRVLAAAAICVIACTLADAGGAKKTTKKEAGTIEVYKTDKGEYRYRIKNADGKTIAMPLPQMSWKSKADCLKAIDELRSILDDATPTEVKTEPKAKEDAKKDADK